MAMIHSIRPCPALLALVAAACLSVGCSSAPKSPPKPPTRPVLQLTHHVGGTHHRLVVLDGTHWLQTFGSQLLLINPETGLASRSVDLGPPGQTGPAVDMIYQADSLWVVIEDDAVVEVSIADPLRPTVNRTLTRDELGLRPRRLSTVDGDLFVSGLGGIAHLPSGQRALTENKDCGRVVRTFEHGLVCTAGRQIIRLQDKRYLGSATDLVRLPQSFGTATIAFTRQTDQGALVGLMNDQLREVNSSTATVAAAGVVHSVRIFGDRLWVAGDDGVTGYAIAVDGTSLSEVDRCALLGSRDVGPLGPEHLAISGSSGRFCYALGSASPTGQQGHFVFAHREASRLSHAVTDGQRILAGTFEGRWMYLIGARAEMTSREMQDVPPPRRDAAVADANAVISDDGTSVEVTALMLIDPETGAMASQTYDWQEPVTTVFHTIAAIDGELWLGHDRGITVLRPAHPESERVAARIRVPGGVQFIFPLLVGGGASFVSEYGGFGVVRYVNQVESPS